MNINNFSNMTDVLNALKGRHEVSDVKGRRWVVIGKLVYVDDEESMLNFPYKTFGLHNVGGCYIGMLKE